MTNARFRRGTIIIALFVVVIVVSIYAEDALSALGVQEQTARRSSLEALANNYVPFNLGAKAFKAADAQARAKLVTGAMTWFKAYTESAAFKTEYAKQREQAKPSQSKPKGTVDDELAKQKAERDKGLAEMKANLAKMPPDMQASMKETIKQMEEMYAQQDKDPQMKGMMRQSVEMERTEADKSDKQRLADHEKKFPANPNQLIARRLQEFLDLSKDVDFNAQLKPVGGKMRFVNPAYEQKSSNWKLCYRAGKPAVDAGRAFATAWLKELQAK